MIDFNVYKKRKNYKKKILLFHPKNVEKKIFLTPGNIWCRGMPPVYSGARSPHHGLPRAAAHGHPATGCRELRPTVSVSLQNR